MPDEQFSDHMRRERGRLNAEREAVFAQQQELDTKLAEINQEFQAKLPSRAKCHDKPAPDVQEQRGGHVAALGVKSC